MSSDGHIEVKVEFPHQVKGAGPFDLSYYAYPVKLTLPGVVPADSSCERRYADFDALRTQLCAAYWYCIVPPLPEKESVQDKLSKLSPAGSSQQSKENEHELLEYRRSALKRFLTRVAYHQELGKSVLLANFMSDDAWRQALRDPVRLPEFLSSTFADTMMNKAWSSNNVSGVAGESAGAVYSQAVTAETDVPSLLDGTGLDATGDYIAHLEASIRALRDRFQLLVARRRVAATALDNFATAFGDVGEGEEDTGLAQAIAAVRDHGRSLSRTSIEQADDETSRVVNTLSYYVGMCAAVNQALQHVRTGLRQVESLGRKARELEAGLPRAAPTDREQQQNNLRLYTERRQRLERDLGGARQQFQRELICFHRDKQFDMRELLKMFGELELNYAGVMKRDWDSLRPIIESLSA